MTARSYPSTISAKGAKQALTQLLYGCTPERLAGFTAEGLARSYRVPIGEVAGLLERARRARNANFAAENITRNISGGLL